MDGMAWIAGTVVTLICVAYLIALVIFGHAIRNSRRPRG